MTDEATEATIDGVPIAEIIQLHPDWNRGYSRIGVPEDKLERFVAYVTFTFDDEEWVEELDIDATDATDARIIAELALRMDYDPGGKIKSLKHIPRGMMYL